MAPSASKPCDFTCGLQKFQSAVSIKKRKVFLKISRITPWRSLELVMSYHVVDILHDHGRISQALLTNCRTRCHQRCERAAQCTSSIALVTGHLNSACHSWTTHANGSSVRWMLIMLFKFRKRVSFDPHETFAWCSARLAPRSQSRVCRKLPQWTSGQNTKCPSVRVIRTAHPQPMLQPIEGAKRQSWHLKLQNSWRPDARVTNTNRHSLQSCLLLIRNQETMKPVKK